MHHRLSCSVLILIFLSQFIIADEQLQSPFLVFGCDRDYYPLSSIIDDEVVGLDVELINRIADYGNFRVEIKAGEWSTVLRKLEDGEIDVVSGIIRTELRGNHFDFSIPYLTEYYSVFVQEDSPFKTIDDLMAGICATLEGDAVLETFIAPEGLDKGMMQAASFYEAFDLVSNGQADYVIAPYSLGMSIMSKFKMKELELYKRSLIAVNYRFAVKKGSGYLFLINDSLSTAFAEGVIDILRDDANFSRQFPISSSSDRLSILNFILITVIILIINFTVYFALKRKSEFRFKRVQDENRFLRRLIEILPLGISWQIAVEEDRECNKGWLKYSSEVEGGRINTEIYKIEDWPLAGVDGSSEVIVSTAKSRRMQIEISGRLEEMSKELSFRSVEIERLRITDELTGFFNYTYLGIKIKEEIERYHFYGQKFCIISIELQERTVKNLTMMAIDIKDILRDSDVAGYNGNGIIIIILPKTTHTEAKTLFEKISIRMAAEGGFTAGVFELPITVDSLLPPEIEELCR